VFAFRSLGSIVHCITFTRSITRLTLKLTVLPYSHDLPPLCGRVCLRPLVRGLIFAPGQLPTYRRPNSMWSYRWPLPGVSFGVAVVFISYLEADCLYSKASSPPEGGGGGVAPRGPRLRSYRQSFPGLFLTRFFYTFFLVVSDHLEVNMLVPTPLLSLAWPGGHASPAASAGGRSLCFCRLNSRGLPSFRIYVFFIYVWLGIVFTKRPFSRGLAISETFILSLTKIGGRNGPGIGCASRWTRDPLLFLHYTIQTVARAGYVIPSTAPSVLGAQRFTSMLHFPLCYQTLS
jgi:hypothetical protein